jgi:hypothetical protein
MMWGWVKPVVEGFSKPLGRATGHFAGVAALELAASLVKSFVGLPLGSGDSPPMVEAFKGLLVNLSSDAVRAHSQAKQAARNDHVEVLLVAVMREALSTTQGTLRAKTPHAPLLFGSVADASCFEVWETRLADAQRDPDRRTQLFAEQTVDTLSASASSQRSVDDWWMDVELTLRRWLCDEPPAGEADLPPLPVDVAMALRANLPAHIQAAFSSLVTSDAHTLGRRSVQHRYSEELLGSVRALQSEMAGLRANATELRDKLEQLDAGAGPTSAVGSWTLEGERQPTTSAGNGLEFGVWKARHRTKPNAFARVKRYDVSSLGSIDDAVLLEAVLLRHAATCERLSHSSRIAANLDVIPRGDSWWVIDRWIDGPTLEVRMKQDRLGPAKVAAISKDVLLALGELHAAGVIRRVLTPATIVLSTPNDAPVLTDFEMAKFVGQAISVTRNRRPVVSAFTAPEVDAVNPDVGASADLFSWAAHVVYMATASVPSTYSGWLNVLPNAGLRPDVAAVVARCLSPAPSKRPRSVKEVSTAIARWK